MEFIRDLIATRGAQLVARYAALGLTMLSAKLGVTIDANGVGAGVGTLVIAGVLMAIDHYSHAKQADEK